MASRSRDRTHSRRLSDSREVALDVHIGRRVRDARGRVVGRLVEAHAEQRQGQLVVDRFELRSYGALDLLAATAIGRALLELLLPSDRVHTKMVAWNEIDIAHPAGPRLLR